MPEVAVKLRGLEQAGLELGERRRERVREAAEAGRAAEPVQRRAADDPPNEQAPLRVRDDRTRAVAAVGDPREDVVERADRPTEQRRAAAQEIALYAVDVRPVGHDQHGSAIHRAQIPLQQERDLARAGRPGDQAETHRPILDRGLDGSCAGPR